MARGGKRKGAGRKPGQVDASTIAAREAIANFVDMNASRFQGWLDEIADTDGPRAAFDCVIALLEFHVPKLARTEITGKGGGAIGVYFGRSSVKRV